MDMTTSWKLATALGLVGAIALSVPSAEARSGRNAAIGFGVAAGALALGAAAAASQPRYYYDSYYDGPYAYAPQPYVYDSYNYIEAPTPFFYGSSVRGSGRYNNRMIPGTNYNPSQGGG
jgi:hypothetical protein